MTDRLDPSRRDPRPDSGKHRLDGADLPPRLTRTPAPTAEELEVLRELHARTNRAHAAA